MQKISPTMAFASTFWGASLTNHGMDGAHRSKTARRPVRYCNMSTNTGKKGFFGKLKDSILRPIVTVPGGGGDSRDLIDCVFCEGSGFCDCDACKGSGKDALGTCFLCEGNTYIKCTVCEGVGTVDRIRRGGTDDKNQYTVKNRKS